MTKEKLKLGVITSGGDAPGMNAALRAVVRTALYNDIEVYGFERGYNGLIENKYRIMNSKSVANIIQRGGTILKTARSQEFMTVEGREKAYQNLKKNGINSLIVIGGDGSFKGASILSEEHNINCVGIPGTIDNDMAGTDYTIGFDTALNTATEAIDKIRDTADAHDRLFIVEVMGRHSGDIALHSGMATGAENIFIPEVKSNLESFIESLLKKGRRQKLVNLLIVAEGNKRNFLELEKIIKEKVKHIEVRACSLGHIQRGGSPSCIDRILATRMGFASVDALINNKNNIMIGVNKGNIVETPLEKAVNNKDNIHKEWIKIAKILAS